MKIQDKTKSQEPHHHGPADQLKFGQQKVSHGKGGYPIPPIKDQGRAGGALMTKGRSHMKQDPVHRRLRARGQGSVQATESLEAAHVRRMSGGAPTNHLHG